MYQWSNFDLLWFASMHMILRLIWHYSGKFSLVTVGFIATHANLVKCVFDFVFLRLRSSLLILPWSTTLALIQKVNM